MRRAKIVATWGPAIGTYDKTLAVLKAGVDVARLNMSHGDHSMHAENLGNVRAAAEELGRPVGIFADLQGPKIRLGRFVGDAKHMLHVGDTFTIVIADVLGDGTFCSTTFKGLPEDVNVGDILLINDGKVALRATAVDDEKVVTEVVVGGEVSNNKGINLPGVAVNVPALSEKDEDDLRWAIRAGVDMVALSFVRNASDIQRVHEIMDEEGRRLPVIAKVEKPQAVDAIEEIIDAFDAIMVARGDLGVELPLEEVPLVQKRAIELARRWAKPVIVATQVLESMIESPTPTRAEASDCANAVLDGADAVMLSGRPAWANTPSKPSRPWRGSFPPRKRTVWTASRAWAQSPRRAAVRSPAPPWRSPTSWMPSTSWRSPSPATRPDACPGCAPSARCWRLRRCHRPTTS